MKRAGFVIFMLLLSTSGYAWEFEKNPDRYPSFGIEAASGHLAGTLKDTQPGAPHTDGGYVQGKLDIRLPISSMITVNFFGEQTGINNNLQFSDGSRVGIGVRVYVQ